MKNTFKRKRRNLISFVLAIVMMLSMATNVFAGWAAYNGTTYNSGNVYLEEKWYSGQQIIHYYANGDLVRSAAGQGNTFWLGTWPTLDNLYDTCYWCYDVYGNIYVIDKAQNLLMSRVGTNKFVVNTSVRGCTGFQRDSGKFGRLVYTNNGSYSLEDLLRGNNFNSNNYIPTAPSLPNNYYVPTAPSISTYYPYVNSDGSSFYHYDSSSRYHKYYWNGSTLYYRGINNSNSSIVLATSVTDVTFQYDGYKYYICYINTRDQIFRYPIGKTDKSYRQQIGNNASSFVESNYVSTGYYNLSGKYKDFEVLYDDDDEYPRVKKSGNNYFFYTSANRYHKYQLNDSTLYYKGTNNSSSSTKLASNVRRIIFNDEGYIVYANTSDDVYLYEIGKTSTSYRDYVGDEFHSFEDDDNDYMSDGYINDYDEWIDFDF